VAASKSLTLLVSLSKSLSLILEAIVALNFDRLASRLKRSLILDINPWRLCLQWSIKFHLNDLNVLLFIRRGLFVPLDHMLLVLHGTGHFEATAAPET